MVASKRREHFEERLIVQRNGKATYRIRIYDDGQAVEPPPMDVLYLARRGKDIHWRAEEQQSCWDGRTPGRASQAWLRAAVSILTPYYIENVG